MPECARGSVRPGVVARSMEAVGILASGMVWPALLTAQTVSPPPLEEIVVTATRREQSLHDVAVSVSVVPGTRLDDFVMNRLEEAAVLIPGVIVGKSVIADYLYIRGLGSGNLDLFEQSVATYVDGVYFGRGRTARNPTFDVERLEVLKGPQGVLFGRNTVGGVINITSRKPTKAFESDVGLSWDPEHEAYRFDGVVSGPLTARLRGRFAAQLGSSDGYVRNTNTGNDEPAVDEWIARGTLAFAAQRDLELSLKLEGGSYDVSGQSHQIALASPQLTRLSLAIDPNAEFGLDFHKSSLGDDGSLFGQEIYEVDLSTAVFEVLWSLSRHRLVGTTSHHQYDLASLGEGDFAPIELLAAGFDELYETFAQDVRIESVSGGRLEYLAGVYFSREELERSNLTAHFDFASVLPVPAALSLHLGNTFETENLSAYAETRYRLSQRWSLSAGLRYTAEDKTGSHRIFYADLGGTMEDPAATAVAAAFMLTPPNTIPNLSRESDDVSSSFVVEYVPSDDVLAYFRFAEAFKTGGFGGLGEAFDGESATAYELGVKARLLDERLSVNVAVFDTELDDLQVSSFDPQTTAFIVQNAAEASTRGVEVDSRWRAGRNLTFSLAAAYLDAQYDRFPMGTCPFVPGDPRVFCDLSGERLQYAPRWSGSLALEWQSVAWQDWSFRGLIDLHATSEYFTAGDADPRSSQHGNAKLDAGGFFTSPNGRWTVGIIGRNLTDRVTSTFIDDVPLGALLGANFLARVDPPRTVTLQLRAAY